MFPKHSARTIINATHCNCTLSPTVDVDSEQDQKQRSTAYRSHLMIAPNGATTRLETISELDQACGVMVGISIVLHLSMPT